MVSTSQLLLYTFPAECYCYDPHGEVNYTQRNNKIKNENKEYKQSGEISEKPQGRRYDRSASAC
jgi:hypothetical protein